MNDADRREAIGVAAELSGRPAHLLEKDIWVVLTLSALFSSPLRDRLVFKGGTSLSKVYGVIDRFSEDVDLTYDIREVVEDLIETSGDILPRSASQTKKWSNTIEGRLIEKVSGEILPLLNGVLKNVGSARARVEGDKAYVDYEPLFEGSGYVAPRVLLEFGAKSTGEPCEEKSVSCDAAPHLPTLTFPTAAVRVMCAESTWWEKATAAHVFCIRGVFRGGERFARHWYDLVMLDASGHAQRAIDDRALAEKVARRKNAFFLEKHDGKPISYTSAISGALRLVPEGDAFKALERDYDLMIDDGLFVGTPPVFAELVERCIDLERRANGSLEARPGT